MKLTKSTWSSILAFILIMLCAVSLPEKAKASDNLEFGPIDETTFWDDWQVIKDRVLNDAAYSVQEAKPKAAVYGGAWSRHVGADRHGKNEVHELIAFEYDGWFVGHMKNSFNDSTWILAKDWNLWRNEYIGFGGFTGLSYGYEKESMDKFKNLNWNKWVPFLAPYVEFTYFTKTYGWNPRLALVGNAATFTMRYEF